ncbi:MAG: glutaminyl-peptide cyclotransferase [Aureliella sp.]
MRHDFRITGLLTLGLLIFGSACAENSVAQRQTVPVKQVRVIRSFPHDPGAFCQGLVVEGNTVFESTGQYGRSSLRRGDLTTGKTLQSQALGDKYFGEGMTIVGDRIFQLTWKQGQCIVYEKKTMKALGVFRYSGEGWGLADNEKEIFLSDGTYTIRVVDPETFKVKRRLKVKDGRRLLRDINELEYFDDHIWANVWYRNEIAKIDPKTGSVVAWIDCSGVYPASMRPSREHVLNGIAYDEESKKLYITGKNWPRVYEIEIVD